jgi:hypothetical protein
LGRATARQRLENGVDQIAGIIPGGSLKEHRWRGDTLFFVIEASLAVAIDEATDFRATLEPDDRNYSGDRCVSCSA